jgi:xanthine dehydrogenase YagR molybdenum-binding subunit
MATRAPETLGAGLERVEAREKVTGAAHYAVEHPADGAVFAFAVQSTIAKGRVRAVDATAVDGSPGVLAVLSHLNAPELGGASDAELCLFQSPGVAYRGQIVAAVVADSLETARDAARRVQISYDEESHDVELRAGHPKLYTPEQVNPAYPAETFHGDFDAAFAGAVVQVDATYSTPAFHNNPMEMHATLAVWDGDGLTLYDSSQGTTSVRDTLAELFGLEPSSVRVIATHVGGGFGSKGMPHPHVVLAAMAAQAVRRPVKLMLTRQQLFSIAGYRTPTIQRLRLGAGPDGRMVAIAHDAISQCSTLNEFAEQTATVTRSMYAAPNRRTTHRLARLDVPSPSWMRAPGECPGMYGLESAMDELARACGLDPIELRIRNEPDREPEEDIPFSSRNVIACMREGARRFGWHDRAAPRREGHWLVGAGMAASTYPAMTRPSQATARALPGGRFDVRVNATDIGTGARTALTQIAAAALDAPVEDVEIRIGDSALPDAPVAGGSAGTSSWGYAVVRACEALRERLGAGPVPDGGIEAAADTSAEIEQREELARYAYGAQFAEVRVHAVTRELHVPRMTGVFAAGRIVNARTARSQLMGGMTMGVSMALHEESVMDPRFGDYVNHDFASYHIATAADAPAIDVAWLEEDDDHLNPMGSKGIGEIGIVGTAAAVANAVYDATGIRVRDLPIRLEKLRA